MGTGGETATSCTTQGWVGAHKWLAVPLMHCEVVEASVCELETSPLTVSSSRPLRLAQVDEFDAVTMSAEHA